MPRSYWRAVIALIGLIALTGAGPPNESEINPAATQNTEPIPSPPTPPASAAGYTPYPDLQADGCYEAKDHDSADLCAQWRAAIAAEKAANWSWWGNWISAIGAFLSFVSVLLVLRAIQQTQEANRISAREYARARVEAKASTKHSERALEIASAALKSDREIGQAQVRAYITLTDVEIVFDANNTESAAVNFSVINTGNSPAHRTDVYFGVSAKGLVGADSTEPTNGVLIGTVRQMGDPRKAFARIPYPLFPGTALPGYAQILLRAFVSFEDVFDEVRTVDFDFGATVSIDNCPDRLPLSDWSRPDVSSVFIRYWKRYGPDAQQK